VAGVVGFAGAGAEGVVAAVVPLGGEPGVVTAAVAGGGAVGAGGRTGAVLAGRSVCVRRASSSCFWSALICSSFFAASCAVCAALVPAVFPIGALYGGQETNVAGREAYMPLAVAAAGLGVCAAALLARRRALGWAALAVLAFGPAVQAAELAGVVKQLDSAASTLTLEDGTELRIPSQDLMDKLHEGDKVLVTFEEKDGEKVVSSVEVTGQ